MKKIIPWLAASAVVMLVLPWLAVTCVNGVSGMMACFILFFAVNPIYAILAGAYAGRQIKDMWASPVITAALFLLGHGCALTWARKRLFSTHWAIWLWEASQCWCPRA